MSGGAEFWESRDRRAEDVCRCVRARRARGFSALLLPKVKAALHAAVHDLAERMAAFRLVEFVDGAPFYNRQSTRPSRAMVSWMSA